MRRLIAVALTGFTALFGVTAPPATAAPDDSSGSPQLQWASDLKPTHGGGTGTGLGALPLHAGDYARAKAAANSRAGIKSKPASAAPTAALAVTDYPNVSPSFQGIYQSGLTPPDTTGAMGPDRYIETINTSYAIYNRSGSQLNSGSLTQLTGVSGGFFGYSLSDPQMMWDPTTQRFYYVVLYFDSLLMSDNGLAIGWSKTATPSKASDFCHYTLGFGSALPDYPKLGDSKDFLIFGYNQFSSFASTYDGSEIATLNKPPAGATCPSTSLFSVHFSGFLRNGDGSLAATPVPANLVDHGAGAGYVVANADLTETPNADYVTVYTVTKTGTDTNGIPISGFSAPRTVSVPTYTMPANATQQGTSYLLDTLDGRFEAAVAASDPDHGGTMAIWTAHAVYGGAGAEERWYEIDPSTTTLLQSGTVGSSSLFAWNGAISPDRADDGTNAAHGGNMAMSVSTSSSSTTPAIQFVTKTGTAPQSSLNNLVQTGGANIDFSCSNTAPCRWGDYSGASPDPAATGGSGGRIWLGNQYNVAGGSTSGTAWRTWIFAVTPVTSAPSASLSFATSAQSLTAGTASSAMRVGISAAQSSAVQVNLSTDSSQGGFSTSATGPWTSTLAVAITSGATQTADFYYRDTKAGSPTITASATGVTGTTQTETVVAAALATISVSPPSSTVSPNGTQVFDATGSDAFGNPVDVSSASWTTTVPGANVSPTTGSSTTFTAGSSEGTGDVTATIGTVQGTASVSVTGTATKPDAPTGLTAKARGKHIGLSWTASAGATSYNVYRGTTPGGEGATPYATGVTSTSFNDQVVTSRTTYYYYVTAVAGGVESDPSAEVSARAR